MAKQKVVVCHRTNPGCMDTVGLYAVYADELSPTAGSGFRIHHATISSNNLEYVLLCIADRFIAPWIYCRERSCLVRGRYMSVPAGCTPRDFFDIGIDHVPCEIAFRLPNWRATGFDGADVGILEDAMCTLGGGP